MNRWGRRAVVVDFEWNFRTKFFFTIHFKFFFLFRAIKIHCLATFSLYQQNITKLKCLRHKTKIKLFNPIRLTSFWVFFTINSKISRIFRDFTEVLENFSPIRCNDLSVRCTRVCPYTNQLHYRSHFFPSTKRISFPNIQLLWRKKNQIKIFTLHSKKKVENFLSNFTKFKSKILIVNKISRGTRCRYIDIYFVCVLLLCDLFPAYKLLAYAHDAFTSFIDGGKITLMVKLFTLNRF